MTPTPVADDLTPRPRAPRHWLSTKRLIAVLILIPIVLYASLVAYFYFDTPDPSTDYLAQLNAPARAVPEADRAWPIYRDAFIAADFVNLDLDPILGDSTNRPQDLIRPDHPTWPDAVAFLKSHQPLLKALRQARHKPGLGLTVGLEGHHTGDDHTALFGSGSSPEIPPDPASLTRLERLHHDHVIYVLLPHLMPMRKAARLIGGDMHLARQQEDPERWMANFHTIVGLARHAREARVAISDLLAHLILKIAIEQAARTLHDHPEFLRDSDLSTLARSIEGLVPHYDTPDFDAERLMFLDTLQRAFGQTGRVTYHGLRFLETIGSGPHMHGPYQPPSRFETARAVVTMPFTSANIASRAEIEHAFDTVFQAALADGSRPLWELLHQPSLADQALDALHAVDLNGTRYGYFQMPTGIAIIARSSKKTTAHLEALGIALVLETYRRQNDQYPDTLAQLVPRYLPNHPIDYSTGQPLRYKLVDQKPLLYGLGIDQTDDGGMLADEVRDTWPDVPETGDWVLYPPPPDPPAATQPAPATQPP
ncbi:MAG: hypothetical protein AAGI68_08345 [Planctomycetota bacterium]